MTIRKWVFDLDVKNKTKIPKITLVEGDTNGNAFEVHLKNLDTGLEDSYVTFTFLKEDGNVVVGNASVLNASEGIVLYLFKGNELSCPGVVLATIEVYNQDGISRFTTPQFKFNVVEQLDNGDAIESTSEYHVLTELINDVEAIKLAEQGRAEAEEIRGIKEAQRQANTAQAIQNALEAAERANNFASLAENNANLAEEKANLAQSKAELAQEKADLADLKAQEASHAIDSINALEDVVRANEQARQEAEQSREMAEQARENAFNQALGDFDNISSQKLNKLDEDATNALSEFDTNSKKAINDFIEETERVESLYPEKLKQHELKMVKVEKELNDYKATMQQVNINQESKQKATGYGVINLPPNAAEGQVSDVVIRGRTLKQEFNYNKDTMEQWSISPNSTKGESKITLKGIEDYPAAVLPVFVKPNTKYGILYTVLTSNVPSFHLGAGAYPFTDTAIPTRLGNVKIITTTKESWTANLFRFYLTPDSTDEHSITISTPRMFELPPGSEIETDFNTLSADQLAQKYPYISGDSVKSTVGAVRIKSVGKNLVDLRNVSVFKQSDDCVITVDEGRNVWKIQYAFANLRDKVLFDNFLPNRQYMVRSVGKRASANALYGVLVYTDGSTVNIPLQGIGNYAEMISFSDPTKNLREIRIGASSDEISYLDLDSFMIAETTNSTPIPYEPYRESNAYIVATDKDTGKILELRSLPNGTKDEINVTDRKLIKRIGEKSNIANGMVIDFADMAEGGTYYAWNDDGETETGTKGDTLGIDATTLIYQLAEPVEIPMEVSGSLVSHPNGTVYVEPVVADAGVYTDKMEVLHQDLPIKALEKLSKVDFMTGVETELDINQAEISEDKLSFTHPELNAGDIVFFEYEYDVESTEGETEVEFYDSRYVVKDDVTGKFYKWNVKVSNGTPTIEVVEV